MGFGFWRLLGAALAGLLFFHGFSDGEPAPNYSFMHSATTAPAISYYDYIVVGGGTAGCPLAATLSQNYSVLLLERGGSPYGNPNITNLSAYGAPLADLSPTSPSQQFISEEGVVNARARVLGGGTCINAGFYTHAPTDYIRGAGWDERLVNESYQWVERAVVFQPVVKEWQSAVRDGLLEVGVLPYNGFTYDHINGTKVGGTIFDLQGHRHTAADLLQYANPSGLTVLLNATVHKVLFRTTGNSRPLAHGVVFRDASGTKHIAYLKDSPKSEIIISSGAIGSPQLLMLSGVGPAEHLRTLNITVVVDQPMVGEGMADNPMNAFFVTSPIPVEVALLEVVGITDFGSYIEASSGVSLPQDSSRVNLPGYSRTREYGMFSPKIRQLSTVPPKQRTTEAQAKAVEYMGNLEDASIREGYILQKVTGPLSSGHLELLNRNPNNNPKVTFNYFKEAKDLEICVQGIQTVEKVIESKAFSKFKYDNYSFPANASISLEQYCKDTVMTIHHYHGGCQVGRVVDHDYKVLGVEALRVIDASTFNYTPGTNPQATVMMLGRYMGTTILNERLANDESKQNISAV